MFNKSLETLLKMTLVQNIFVKKFDFKGYQEFKVGFKLEGKKLIANPSPTTSKHLCEGAHEEFKYEFKFAVSEDFDRTKATIFYFHVNGGLNEEQIQYFHETLGYNICCFHFLRYGENNFPLLEKRLTIKLEHLVQQAEIVLEALEAILKGENYYGADYRREKDLIFIGRSLGSMVAVKLAAKLEKGNNRPAKCIAIVCPVNLHVAVDSFIGGLVPLQRLQAFSSRVLEGLDVKDEGISESEIKQLMETPMTFIAVEADRFCTIEALQTLVEHNSNNKKIIQIIKAEPENFSNNSCSKNSSEKYFKNLKIVFCTEEACNVTKVTKMLVASATAMPFKLGFFNSHDNFALQNIAAEEALKSF